MANRPNFLANQLNIEADQLKLVLIFIDIYNYWDIIVFLGVIGCIIQFKYQTLMSSVYPIWIGSFHMQAKSRS
jgi:hypothetical protein